MRGARQGNAVEVRVAKELEASDWIVGSRRHTGGAGDLLAVSWVGRPEVWLIEVKATTQIPWRSTFGPARRRELLEAAAKIGAEPWLAWWPPRRSLQWIPASEWPS